MCVLPFPNVLVVLKIKCNVFFVSVCVNVLDKKNSKSKYDTLQYCMKGSYAYLSLEWNIRKQFLTSKYCKKGMEVNIRLSVLKNHVCNTKWNGQD